MSLNREKIVAGAQKFIQRGQLDKAIKEFQRLLEEDPKDVRTMLKIGDLYSKKGERDSATQTYLRVAEYYSDQGFFLKAVAVYKQILKVDPTLIQVNIKLADLYGQLGLSSDAIAQYQNITAYFEKAGETQKTIPILRQIIELEPTNIGTRVKLAEVFAKHSMTTEAVVEFGRAAGLLKQSGRLDDYARVSERLLHFAPNDPKVSLELADFYLGQNDVKRALAKLQVSFKANPRDVRTLEMLAQAFSALGQEQKTLSVYRELAKIHEEQGDEAKRAFYQQKILELSPDDDTTRPVVEKSEPEQKRPLPPRPAATGAQASVAEPRASARAPTPTPRSPEALQKLLTETDVYLKYGLKEKALDHLKKIFSFSPENLDAHAKVRDIYLGSGDIDGAKNTLLTMGKIALTQDRHEQAQQWLTAALSLDGDFLQARELLNTLPEEYRGAADQSETIDADDVIDVDVDDGVPPGSDDGIDIDLDADSPPETTGAALHNRASDTEDQGPERDFVPTDGEVLRPPEFEDDTEAPAQGSPPSVEMAARETADDDATVGDVTVGEATLGDAALAEPDVSDELEEAEFFEQQGLIDDAIDGYRSVLEKAPGTARARERLAFLLGRDPSPAEEPSTVEPRTPLESDAPPNDDFLGSEASEPSPDSAAYSAKVAPPARVDADEPEWRVEVPAPASVPREDRLVSVTKTLINEDALGDSPFDLAGELAEDFSDAPSAGTPAGEQLQFSVEDVLAEFKKGIAQTVPAEDFSTHYDLGIAYKEMGLFDDAINEFQLAARASSREVDALTMVGVCYMELGDVGAAVGAFKRAAGSDHLTAKQAPAVRYELANALEITGDAVGSQSLFAKIAAAEPTFRDAKIRAGSVIPVGEEKDAPKKGKISYV